MLVAKLVEAIDDEVNRLEEDVLGLGTSIVVGSSVVVLGSATVVLVVGPGVVYVGKIVVSENTRATCVPNGTAKELAHVLYPHSLEPCQVSAQQKVVVKPSQANMKCSAFMVAVKSAGQLLTQGIYVVDHITYEIHNTCCKTLDSCILPTGTVPASLCCSPPQALTLPP